MIAIVVCAASLMVAINQMNDNAVLAQSNLVVVAYWYNIIGQRIAQSRYSPPLASRAYALLATAQKQALEATPHQLATLDSASATVVNLLFATDFSPYEHQWNALGQEIGKAVVTQRERDNAAEVLADQRSASKPAIDPLARQWRPAIDPEAQAGIVPLWYIVQPYYLVRADQFRPVPPPAVNSPAFITALQEVFTLSASPTQAQMKSVYRWADGVGTATPVGHWNRIALQALVANPRPLNQAVDILYLLHTALHDASIATWEAKYHYNFIRPSQYDTTIWTPIGVPNFPSYPSGHAVYSATAARILSHYFPTHHDDFWQQAHAAADSRLYGGIHYRFDVSAGIEMGTKLADWVLGGD